jgi:hypothetical protein
MQDISHTQKRILPAIAALTLALAALSASLLLVPNMPSVSAPLDATPTAEEKAQILASLRSTSSPPREDREEILSEMSRNTQPSLSQEEKRAILEALKK